MSAATPTLVSALSPFVKSGYKTLFSQEGGYLLFRDNKWSVSKAAPKDVPEYYSNLVESLVRNQDNIREVANLDVFVAQLNAARTSALYPNPPVWDSNTNFVYFNSKSPSGANFLSNFFETVVPFRSHKDSSQIALYASSENAYQAHKLTVLAERGEDSSLDTEWIDTIATASPSDAKKLSQQAPYEPLTPETARMKAALMSDILFAKFRSNPVIHRWLDRTGTRQLVEDTSDNFWGSKDPRDPALQKSYQKPIDENSRNVLGRILVTVRRELSL